MFGLGLLWGIAMSARLRWLSKGCNCWQSWPLCSLEHFGLWSCGRLMRLCHPAVIAPALQLSEAAMLPSSFVAMRGLRPGHILHCKSAGQDAECWK